DLHPDSNYLYQVQKAAYHPNAVFVNEYNTRFFPGANASRTLNIFNDRMISGNFTLRWGVNGTSWQSSQFSLGPAEQIQQNISFMAPGMPGPFSLQLELSDATGLLFTNALAYSTIAQTPLSLPSALKVGLYDPN